MSFVNVRASLPGTASTWERASPRSDCAIKMTPSASSPAVRSSRLPRTAMKIGIPNGPSWSSAATSR